MKRLLRLVPAVAALVLASCSGGPGDGTEGQQQPPPPAPPPPETPAPPPATPTGATDGGPVTGRDCSIILCGEGTRCVYAQGNAVCAAPCLDDGPGCAGGSCSCAASCPTCKDCVLACL